jgi:CubicO group peptidase (beta-lactamase class C family)
MKKHKQIILLTLFTLYILIPFDAYSQDIFSLKGRWEGEMEIPGTPLEFNVDFSQLSDGSWKGDISIPAQMAKDLPLSDISISGDIVTFKIRGVPGDPTFKGKFNETGKKITGDLIQSGQTFPFHLESSADPTTVVKESLLGFDKIIEDALKTFDVPGLALAIVKEDQVVYAKGFGYRDIENKLPVTPDTLMAIGSSTKAFTTYAMGTLVDQGKLEWDTPVRKFIPWFRLKDTFMIERLTPRDMVTHRSGLPRHDLVWYNNFTSSREEMVRSLAHLQPSADLRERFQYNNLMFLTSGYLIETLTGKKWEDSIRMLVFEPLDMKRSNFSVEDSQKDADFALPYRENDGKIEKIPFRNISTIGPAGSINSCVNEMSHWLIVHLNQGKFQGKQLINPSTLQDMHLAHMPTGATPTRPEISPANYGMGWFVDNYRGHRRFHHGGNIDGFSAMVSMLPHDGLGFVVLTNMNGTGLPELIIRHAADRILGLDPIDWLGEAAKRREEGEEAAEEAEQKKEIRKKTGTKPSHKLGDYTGDYENPGYGILKVELNSLGLQFTFNKITTPLEHWHYDTFNGKKAADPTFEDMKLTFRTDANGNIAAIAAPFEPTVDEIIFSKKPDARMFDPEYLKKFIGDYELVGQTLTVTLKGNTLTVQIPGQPVLELVPDLGGEFYLKEVKVISLAFIEDEQGKVTGLELYQPDGTYTATKNKPEVRK